MNPIKNLKQCSLCQSSTSSEYTQITNCPHLICHNCISSQLLSKSILSHINSINSSFFFQCHKCHKGTLTITYEEMDKILFKKPQSQPKSSSKIKPKLIVVAMQPSKTIPNGTSVSKECQSHKLIKGYYCNTCKEEICKECVNVEHMFHQWISIDEIKQKIKAKMNDWTFKNYQQLEGELNKNEEMVMRELKESYDKFQGKITMMINDLNSYLGKVVQEREMKIKQMKCLSGVIRKVYMKLYKDIDEVESKGVKELKYILKAKYEYRAMTIAPFKIHPTQVHQCNDSSVIVHNIKGKPRKQTILLTEGISQEQQKEKQQQHSSLESLFTLPKIEPPSIHYSFIKHSKSPIVYSSKIRKVKECLNMIKTKNTVGSMIFLNENEIYYSSGNIHQDTPEKTIQIYNMKQRKWDTINTSHKNSVTYLCQINNTQIASGSYDTMIKLFNITTNQEEGEFKGHTGAVTMLKLWGLNHLISSSVDSSIRLWEIASFKCLFTANNKHNAHILSICIAGDVLYSAGNDKLINVWLLNDSYGKDGHEAISSIGVLKGHSDRIHILCGNSNDNGIIASGSNDHSIRIWKTIKRKCIGVLIGHKSYISALVFLVDNRLASGSGDKIIRIWNLNKMHCDLTLQGQDGPIFSLLTTKDGKLMAGYQQNIIRLWG